MSWQDEEMERRAKAKEENIAKEKPLSIKKAVVQQFWNKILQANETLLPELKLLATHDRIYLRGRSSNSLYLIEDIISETTELKGNTWWAYIYYDIDKNMLFFRTGGCSYLGNYSHSETYYIDESYIDNILKNLCIGRFALRKLENLKRIESEVEDLRKK